MWVIFVIIPTVVSAVGSLFSLTGGMGFVAAAVATSEWQRRKSYRPGEGRFTERVNDKYYGVGFKETSDCDLSNNLWKLSVAAPSLFDSLTKLRFDITKSEGEFLRALLAPALLALDDFDVAKQLAIDDGREDAMNLLYETTDRLTSVIIPVVRWLEQFPRVRKVS